MSNEDNKTIDLLERIKNAKILSGDDPVDFSYPEGFLNAAKSLQFLPDDATRIQTLSGLTQTILFL